MREVEQDKDPLVNYCYYTLPLTELESLDIYIYMTDNGCEILL